MNAALLSALHQNWIIIRGMCTLSDNLPQTYVVLDREVDQEKSLEPVRSSRTMTTMRLVTPQGRVLV